MENNTQQNEITEQDENNGVLTSMHNKLDSLNVSFNKNWCIYKVPEYILKGDKEGEIRNCYQQESRLSSDEFVEMIVLDAAFLIYHCLILWSSSFDVPLVGNNLKVKMANANYDLIRLENQIPYFVLKGIFDIAFGHIYPPITLIRATLGFINCIGIDIPGTKAIKSTTEGSKITVESNIKHLLDLQRMCCCLSLSKPLRNQPITNPTTDSDSYIHKVMSWICPSSLCNRLRKRHLKTKADYNCNRHLCYTAKQLFDAGVTFVAGETDNILDVTFSKGKLTISKLKIQDTTESHLRNLVYFEQCHYYRDTYFIDYIVFLDQLIDTVEDVQVLVKNKIISNYLGSDDDVVKLFNNIGKNVLVLCKNYYCEVSDDLNRYASTRRHQWMAILRSQYFNQPWTILSVIAAIILFVLTLLQTIAAYIYK
ncbi:UPF0481 protein At3g47200-like isoform X2 [Chenopodium quinoa]|uniref:UPF0481 protein At3g47200-like isoform X2 n=1 Tax=Chenopodium quinoa TaxID=63459 RepID=UPI000B7716B1|nr:UPF0481 protein At3g47200-like isoform X2 [Chenopodium quinoa]